MTYMRTWMSSKFGQIRTRTAELAALEHWKNLQRHNGENNVHVFCAVFDRILFIVAGNDNTHKSLDDFEIQPNLTTKYRVSCP